MNGGEDSGAIEEFGSHPRGLCGEGEGDNS